MTQLFGGLNIWDRVPEFRLPAENSSGRRLKNYPVINRLWVRARGSYSTPCARFFRESVRQPPRTLSEPVAEFHLGRFSARFALCFARFSRQC